MAKYRRHEKFSLTHAKFEIFIRHPGGDVCVSEVQGRHACWRYFLDNH